MSDSFLYTIKDLQIKSFSDVGNRIVLDKINLNIKKGEKLGLIGETGSGKSMIGSLLMNMIPEGCGITKGSIINHFNSSVNMSNLRGVKVSMISQDPMHSLNPLQTIETQFSTILMKRFGFNKTEAKEQILGWVEKVQLYTIPGILTRYPHQLSGGQIQRIMIALALSIDPRFIIADEITTGLDANIKKEILNLLFSLQKDNDIAVLLISHDVMSVQKYCDRIAVLQSGRIIEIDDTEKILYKSEDDYVKTITNTQIKLPNRAVDNLSDPLIKKIVQVKKLYKSYWKGKNSVSVLNDVTFDVYEKETLGVIGESGSGKTTLVKIILNILEYDSGKIILCKNQNDKSRVFPTREFGAVFQDSQGSLNPQMSVYDILCEPLILRGVKEKTAINKKIKSVLDKVHLSVNLMNMFPYQLSGGQRQRVSIARALILEPSLLILDEPTSALDIYTQDKILILLKEIQAQRNLSYIFISHDLGVVSETSDRIAVLYKGNIIETGKTKDVLINPSNDYTKKLIDSNIWMSKKSNI